MGEKLWRLPTLGQSIDTTACEAGAHGDIRRPPATIPETLRFILMGERGDSWLSPARVVLVFDLFKTNTSCNIRSILQASFPLVFSLEGHPEKRPTLVHEFWVLLRQEVT